MIAKFHPTPRKHEALKASELAMSSILLFTKTKAQYHRSSLTSTNRSTPRARRRFPFELKSLPRRKTASNLTGCLLSEENEVSERQKSFAVSRCRPD